MGMQRGTPASSPGAAGCEHPLLLPAHAPRLFPAQPLCGSGAPCSDQVPPGLPLCLQCLQLLGGGHSCGRTLFPGSCSAGDGHLVDQAEVAGLRLLGLRAPLPVRKLTWATVEQVPARPLGPHVPPQPQCSTSPHRCVHQHRLPRAPRAVLQLKEGADGQTDKQTRSCTIPSLYCSLQLAAAAQQTRALCAPNPSLSSAGAARRGRGFPRAEAPGAEHLPARGG